MPPGIENPCSPWASLSAGPSRSGQWCSSTWDDKKGWEAFACDPNSLHWGVPSLQLTHLDHLTQGLRIHRDFATQSPPVLDAWAVRRVYEPLHTTPKDRLMSQLGVSVRVCSARSLRPSQSLRTSHAEATAVYSTAPKWKPKPKPKGRPKNTLAAKPEAKTLSHPAVVANNRVYYAALQEREEQRVKLEEKYLRGAQPDSVDRVLRRIHSQHRTKTYRDIMARLKEREQQEAMKEPEALYPGIDPALRAAIVSVAGSRAWAVHRQSRPSSQAASPRNSPEVTSQWSPRAHEAPIVVEDVRALGNDDVRIGSQRHSTGGDTPASHRRSGSLPPHGSGGSAWNTTTSRSQPSLRVHGAGEFPLALSSTSTGSGPEDPVGHVETAADSPGDVVSAEASPVPAPDGGATASGDSMTPGTCAHSAGPAAAHPLDSPGRVQSEAPASPQSAADSPSALSPTHSHSSGHSSSGSRADGHRQSGSQSPKGSARSNAEDSNSDSNDGSSSSSSDRASSRQGSGHKSPEANIDGWTEG